MAELTHSPVPARCLRFDTKIIPDREEVNSPAVLVHFSTSRRLNVCLSVCLSDDGGTLILCPSISIERWALFLSRTVYLRNRVSTSTSTFLRGLFPVMRQRRPNSVFLRGELLSSLSLKQTDQGSSCAELRFKGTGATQHSTH